MELPAFFLLLSLPLPPPTLSWMYLEVWELLVRKPISNLG